jgi:SpoVK/Ycf46/Vps4 family AAA+-type ATPase
VLGTFLTWLAERTSQVFVVATANDIESLPPELVRKGRFDEMFFVDLPRIGVRKSILEIHLGKRGQDVSGFDIEQLAKACRGFSGAEIEQAVVASLYAAHAQQSPLQTRHIVEEFGRTRPLSVVMAERLNAVRRWANGRTVNSD